MSLIEGHMLAIAVAAGAAVALPIMLLQPDERLPAEPRQPKITKVEPNAPSGLSYALTAPPLTPGRTPAGESGIGGDAPAAEEAAPEPAPLPALVGLVTQARGRGVALVKGSDGATVSLAPGETVSGWTLVRLGRDQAVFELGGSRQVARLDFGNKSAPIEQASAPAAEQPPAEGAPPAAAPAANEQLKP